LAFAATRHDRNESAPREDEMALIEGFRVQNYRALRDVTLGRLSHQQQGEPLSPFTVVIGKNGAGKSTLFDAFGFVADCLAHDVETACDMKQRGG
jgi:AAA15 family ATPase/GTPase